MLAEGKKKWGRQGSKNQGIKRGNIGTVPKARGQVWNASVVQSLCAALLYVAYYPCNKSQSKYSTVFTISVYVCTHGKNLLPIIIIVGSSSSLECIHTQKCFDCDLLEKCYLQSCSMQAPYYTCTPHLSPCFLYNPNIPSFIYLL